jgi:hypothetical protein
MWMPDRWDRGRTVIALVAVAALVVGVVIGALVADRSPVLNPTRSSGAAPRPTAVTPGAIEQSRLRASTGWEFELPVHNSTATPVDVDVVAFTGVLTAFTSARARQVPPGAWDSIRFSAPANCDVRPPDAIASVKLRVSADGERAEVTRPLPEEGQALVDYDKAVCGTGSLVTPDDLAGVWILERAYGPDMYLAGSYLMRFTRRGEIVADDDGRLLSRDASIRGRYRMRGEVMTITSQNASGCGIGARSTWRARLNSADRLTMVYLNGDCPEGDQGDVWVSRRVLLDDGLPETG